jgi:hypothetical protein
MDGQRSSGLLSAQVVTKNEGPGLRCFKIRVAGWATGHVSFWAGPFRAEKFTRLGQNGLSLFHLSFCFSIFRESKIISKIAQKLTMIKKFSSGKILDKKIFFMSVTFSCNFQKLCILLLVKFDTTIGFNWKIESN